MSKVYKYVQEKFIKAIQDVIDGKERHLPWQKSWVGYRPVNYYTRRPYSGVNLLLLSGGEYLSFTQLKKLQKKQPNLKIKKGAKQHMVIYWNLVDKKDENGEIVKVDDKPVKIPILRYYRVFHQSDIENLKSLYPPRNDIPKIDIAEEIIKDYIRREDIEIKTVNGGNHARYFLYQDYIEMPDRNQFVSSEEYYSTIFHEIAHSTGHKDRLDRFDFSSSHFGSESYSKEELIAEIAANMVLSALNISNTSVEKNSVSYLYGWMNAIKEDKTLIISAAKHAEKAANYILGDYAKELFGEDENIAEVEEIA